MVKLIETFFFVQTLDELPLDAETVEKGYSFGADPTGLPRIHGLPTSSMYSTSSSSDSYSASPKNPKSRKSSHSGELQPPFYGNADSNGSGRSYMPGLYPTVDAWGIWICCVLVHVLLTITRHIFIWLPCPTLEMVGIRPARAGSSGSRHFLLTSFVQSQILVLLSSLYISVLFLQYYIGFNFIVYKGRKRITGSL